MEHAGATFLREESLFRSVPTAGDKIQRAALLLHETWLRGVPVATRAGSHIHARRTARGGEGEVVRSKASSAAAGCLLDGDGLALHGDHAGTGRPAVGIHRDVEDSDAGGAGVGLRVRLVGWDGRLAHVGEVDPRNRRSPGSRRSRLEVLPPTNTRRSCRKCG